MFLFFGGLSKKNKRTRRAQGLCFFVFGASRKNYRRAQGLWFFLFWCFKNTSPIGGHKGRVFVFFLGGLPKKTNPIGGHKGCAFCFCGASTPKKKSNRRAQGLWFCFFWGCKKTNPIGGHKGCVFAFLVLSEKTNPIGGHKGCIFGFLWGFQKKQIQYEGRDWRERLLERNKQSTCRRFASGSSLRFVRFGSLFYTLAVRFGSVSQLPVSGRFPVRAVRFPVRGSVREPSSRYGAHSLVDGVDILGWH